MPEHVDDVRTRTRQRGTLYDRAGEFMAALERQESAAAQDMLAAWSDAYWASRQELDDLLAKVAAARAAGVPVNRSWLNQRRRLQNVLATTREQMTTYAAQGARAVTTQQRRALQAATSDAASLVRDAVDQGLPGWNASLLATNPDNLANLVGFLGDGTPLDRLARSMGDDAATRLRQVLTAGITQGWSQDRMVRAFTEGLAVTHSRAVTILRTESLRVYRETSRQTYAANRTVIGTWVWTCALDRRSCAGCVMMHGTEHTPDETLDGHPRCRCAMVPRTVSWEDLLGPAGADLPDTRPPVNLGTDWFRGQPPSVQRAMIGPRKWDAWQAGEFDLPDLVGRHWDPDWGTMRSERSLKAIREGRNANWSGERPDAAPSRYTPEQREQGAAIFREANADKRARWLVDYAPGGDLDDPGMYARLLAEQAALDAQPRWTPPWATMDPEAWEDAVQRTNPNWQGKGNCSNVTTAWELRRRGYDVTAHQDQDGRQFDQFLNHWGNPAYRRETWLQADKAISQLPDGARGAVVCLWKPRGGHIFNWEVRDGRVHWIESQNQSGEYDLADLRRRAKTHVWWVRLDDLDVTEDLNDYLTDWRPR